MCGIAGVINSSKSKEELNSLGHQFTKLLHHRGPDGYGVKTFSSSNGKQNVLSHTRLKILDLSELGKQPMSCPDLGLTISFNGEIYNFIELRDELRIKGYSFQSDCDTEVIIKAYKEWGKSCFKKFNGMWAIALWDHEKEELLLSRDRLGIKPLYYHFSDGEIIFSSEPKALLAYCPKLRKLNYKAISSYLSFRYCLQGDSFFSGIKALEAGSNLIFRDSKIRQEKFWQLPICEVKANKSEDFYLEQVAELLSSSVSLRMRSDVPFGAFLSGGLDSSGLVALMAQKSESKIKTFSIGFDLEGFNEFEYSRMVANKYHTTHKEISLNVQDYLSIMDRLIEVKDAPLAVPNEIALHQLSKVLKEDITVVLSGEGADELFGGYGRIFRSAYDYQRMLCSQIDPKLEENLAKKYNFKKFKSLTEHFLSQYSYVKVHKKKELLNKNCFDHIQSDPHYFDFFKKQFELLGQMDSQEKYMWVFQRYHLEGLLGRLDSSTMSVSVEGRVPFVDHRLIEAINQVPIDLKMKWRTQEDKKVASFLNSDQISEKHDVTKYLLRTFLSPKLPSEVVERKKVGFPVPLSQWLSGEMKEYAKERLLEKNSKISQLFNYNEIEKSFQEVENSPQVGMQIWMILNIQKWLSAYSVEL